MLKYLRRLVNRFVNGIKTVYFSGEYVEELRESLKAQVDINVSEFIGLDQSKTYIAGVDDPEACKHAIDELARRIPWTLPVIFLVSGKIEVKETK